MSWLDGLTKNWADLIEGDPDPQLRPVLLPDSPAQSVQRVAAIVAHLSRWRVVTAEPESGTLHATHATGLWGFLDDVHIRCEPHPAGTCVRAHSQSRIGRGDLGQNARNLRALTAALSLPQER